MNFYDSVEITINSGKGGDGCASARREKYVAYGGPNGGNGGRGGSVLFEATHNEMTLLPYKQTKHFKASPGMPGQTKEMYGEGAEDLVLYVPCGTVIKETSTGNILAHLINHGDRYVALQGGKGGVGNMHFKSSQKQFANFALLGEPGQHKGLTLELMLLADIALIGTPSVGKSSLINVVSDVKAKTADYPFTTLIPNLGMISHKGRSFSMIDVPGLIEGASEGKGLGNEFLRHILKSRIFVFCIDCSRFDTGLEEFPLLFQEIQQYLCYRHGDIHHELKWEHGKIAWYIYEQKSVILSEVEGNETKSKNLIGDPSSSSGGPRNIDTGNKLLYKKYLIPTLTKIDTIEDESLRSMLRQQLASVISKSFQAYGDIQEEHVFTNIQQVSILMPESSERFLDVVMSYLDDPDTFVLGEREHETIDQRRDRRQPVIIDCTDRELDRLVDDGYIPETDRDFIKIRSVDHPEIAYLTFVLPRGNDEAEIWYWQTLGKENYLKAYERAGARKGDIFKVKSRYEGLEDKYILRD